MALTNKELLKLYGDMVLVRAFEEKVDELISMAKITGTTHLGIGQEAVMAGANHELKKTVMEPGWVSCEPFQTGWWNTMS